jgi:hypothetical protein
MGANLIEEIKVDVVPLDVCGVVFDCHYMYMREYNIHDMDQPIIPNQGC